MAVRHRAAAGTVVVVIVNVALGSALVWGGAAGWLWERLQRDVAWRTGPTAVGTLCFFAICWGAWLIVNVALRSAAAASFAARAFVSSCVIVALQVLMPSSMWLLAALALLLSASLLNAYLVREPLARAITAFAWSGAGLALASLLIHPWFIGQPLFVMRLAILMTAWDWLGQRLGVTQRIARLLPSLYCGSSGWIADQARVAR